MWTSRTIRRVLSQALLVSALATAIVLPSYAEETKATKEIITEVVVTGSRIAAPNLESTSPIQVVTSKEIQQGGKADVIDFMNQLPQNFQNAATDFSNTSSGLATPGGVTTANLRGLGTQRTLVLVNGRRLGTGDPNTANPNSSPDLDQIPTALIERVEVVTGGASAVYGSDAIAGVVNFIMKKNFEGVQLDGQIGEYFHDNSNDYVQSLQTGDFERVSGSDRGGRSVNFNLLLGANIADGAGNVTAYAGYMKAHPILSGDRDFGACQLNLNTAKNGVVCGGSSSSNLFGVGADTYTVVGNQFLPWPQAGSNPPARFNSQKFIYMSRGDERYTGGFMAHVDVADYAKPYAEFNFMSDRTNINVAPSGLFQSNPIDPTGNGNFNINCSNPLLSAQQRAILCTPAQIAADTAVPGSASANINIGRRNVEGGSREAFWDHTNYRAAVGMTGDLGNAWTYDAYGQYYYTTLFNSNEKFLSFASITDALQVTGTAVNPVCISGSSSCVPWNIFSTGGVTDAQVNSLYTSGTSRGTVTQRTLHADVTGQLGEYGIKSPLASDGIAVNVGFEHRNERLTFAPDSGELSGLLSGFGGASVAVNNSDSVKEGFVELRAPLIQDRPGVKDLVFDTGYRRSDYELAGAVNTYKFEVQYSPVTDVRFRGSYQRAIRAPNIIELFTPAGFSNISSPSVDPCAPTRDENGVLIPAAASLADCIRSGVTPAQYGNGGTTNTILQCVALQCGQLAGGSTELKPEKADSVTFGLTFTPTFLRNFTASIDFYRIKVDEEVGVLPAPVILQSCLDTGNPLYCGQIVRTSGGSISGSSVATGGYIVQTNRNIGAAEVSGIDLQANYRLDLPGNLGSLAFALFGTELLNNKTTPYEGAHTYDCVGLYGPSCQTLNPRWRHNLRVTWAFPFDVEVSAYWRYIGKVKLDSNTSDETLSDGNFDAFDARIGAQNYFDLSASWDVLKQLQLRAGINNVADKDPPVVSANVAQSGAANSFPTYDQLGRQVFMAFTAKF